MAITKNTTVSLSVLFSVLALFGVGGMGAKMMTQERPAPDCMAIRDCVDCDELAPCVDGAQLLTVKEYREAQAFYLKKDDIEYYIKYTDKRMDDLKDDIRELKQIMLNR